MIYGETLHRESTEMMGRWVTIDNPGTQIIAGDLIRMLVPSRYPYERDPPEVLRTHVIARKSFQSGNTEFIARDGSAYSISDLLPNDPAWWEVLVVRKAVVRPLGMVPHPLGVGDVVVLEPLPDGFRRPNEIIARRGDALVLRDIDGGRTIYPLDNLRNYIAAVFVRWAHDEDDYDITPDRKRPQLLPPIKSEGVVPLGSGAATASIAKSKPQPKPEPPVRSVRDKVRKRYGMET